MGKTKQTVRSSAKRAEDLPNKGFPAHLRRNRQIIEAELLHSPERKYFSPVYYGQYQITIPLIIKYAKGKLIDLGGGNLPYYDLISSRVKEYDSADLFSQDPRIKYHLDLQNMAEIKNENYDTAICLEVLEHIPDPLKALGEIARILKPGGMLILSAPHLSRLHDEPYDYFRFTKYGLIELLNKAGFDILDINVKGGLFCFIGHQISTMCLGVFWRIPILKEITFFLNRWIITHLFFWLDKVTDKKGIFAQGYSISAKKR